MTTTLEDNCNALWRTYLENFAAFGPNKNPLIHHIDRTDMAPPVTGLRVEERVAEVLKFIFGDQLHALVEHLWATKGRLGGAQRRQCNMCKLGRIEYGP